MQTGGGGRRIYYPPPGPHEDPWGPYIQEAAARFRVPGHWVRAVMHQELGGEQQATSPVGAMGLMQIMPTTYDELRVRHQLGDDPYDPHNNILAGTAYIREMYDRYGAPGFLAAYNAGPDRVDSYLAGHAALPDETVNYLAAITPEPRHRRAAVRAFRCRLRPLWSRAEANHSQPGGGMRRERRVRSKPPLHVSAAGRGPAGIYPTGVSNPTSVCPRGRGATGRDGRLRLGCRL